ncbi:MAG: hypothetical protein ACXABG_12745, partial [Promethearchaeota archaeon]
MIKKLKRWYHKRQYKKYWVWNKRKNDLVINIKFDKEYFLWILEGAVEKVDRYLLKDLTDEEKMNITENFIESMEFSENRLREEIVTSLYESFSNYEVLSAIDS